MNANELMIGDWVRMHYPLDLDMDMRPERINVLTKGVDVDCEPIPLTEKILEKNGFTHRNADKILTKQSWTCECGGCTIHAKYNFGFLYFNIYGKPLKPNMFAPHATMHIQYVHELQHALRLCGIDKEIVL